MLCGLQLYPVGFIGGSSLLAVQVRVVKQELNWEHKILNRWEASKAPSPLSAMPFDRADACHLVLLYFLDTDKSVAFVGPSAAQGWSAVGEVSASVPLIWAGRAGSAGCWALFPKGGLHISRIWA